MRTPAQRAGDAAEALAERRLEAAGWTILGRHVRVSRAEIDIVAVDPGPPPALVAVEVRWRARRDYGLADVAYFPHVARTGADGFPALADWVERLRSRPAVAAA